MRGLRVGTRRSGGQVTSSASRACRGAVAAVTVIAAGIVMPEIPAAAVTPPPSLYVVATGNDAMTPVSSSTGTLDSPVSVGLDPSDIAVTPDGRRAYVANEASDSVTPIDLTATPPAPGQPIAVGSHPVALAITPDGSRVYVVNKGSGTITPISVATNSVEAPIVVGPEPQDIAINPDGNRAYVSVGGVNLVWVNLLDRRPSVPVKVGLDPRGIVITPNGAVTYVVSRGENKVYLLYEDKVVKTVSVGSQPEHIAISADTTHAYVTSAGSNSLTDLELTPGGDVTGVSRTIALGAKPTDVTFMPSGATAYVTSATANSLIPVTVATASAGTPIGGFSTPVAVVASPDQSAQARVVASSLTAIGCSQPPPSGVASQVCVADSGTVSLDASTSIPVTTPVASYRWDFGDGSAPATTTTPTTTHLYAAPGSYLPTVTTTTTGGTTYYLAFTGQTMSRNGSPVARAMASVRVIASTAVAADSPLVYVANFDGAGNGQITPILNPSGGSPQKLNAFPGGRLPTFTAVAPTGRAILIPDRISGTVSVTAICPGGSGLSFEAGNSVAVGVSPYRIAIAPQPVSTNSVQDVYAAYVTDLGTPHVRRLELTINKTPCAASLSVPANSVIPVGGTPSGIAITPDGGTAYVTVPDLNAVVPVRLSTLTPLAPIPVGNAPQAVAITPSGYLVMVVNNGSNSVTPIYENKAQPSIPVGANPQDIAISPDGSKAFVTNGGDTTLSRIIITDAQGNAVMQGPGPANPNIALGVNPTGVTITPDGTTAWVTSYAANKVLPINLATGSSGPSLTGFNGPIGIVAAPDQAAVAGLSLTAPTSTACSTATPAGVSAQLCLALGGTVSFDASGSVPKTTPIVSYSWDFGDGTATTTTSGPTISHGYSTPGAFLATVTLTDAAGTSVSQVFTGQTMTRNGGSQARGYGIVKVIAAPTPSGTPLVYVANNIGDSLTPVATPSSSPVQVGNSFPAGRSPAFPAITPDGRAIVTPNYATGELTTTAVCPEGSTLSFKRGNAVSGLLKPQSVAVAPQPVSTTATTKTWAVFVTNSGGQDVRQFLLTVGTGPAVCGANLTTPLSNSVIPVGPRPYGIVINPTGTRAYVSVSGTGPDETRDTSYQAGERHPGAVVPIDLSTATAGTPVVVGSDPRGIAITPNGSMVYVANYGDGTVTPIMTSGMNPQPGAAIQVGDRPLSVAVNAAGTLALVTNNGALTVTPINVITGETFGAINVGSVPTGVTFTLDGSMAYVTSYAGNSLIPIDPVTRVAGSPIRGVTAPLGIVASPGVS